MKTLTVVGVSKGPGGVVALTRYRGLQFSSLHLRREESLPHVIGERKESDPEASNRVDHRHIAVSYTHLTLPTIYSV